MVSIYSTHGAAVVNHGFSHLPVQPYLDCRPLPIQITRAVTGLTERLVCVPAAEAGNTGPLFGSERLMSCVAWIYPNCVYEAVKGLG